MYYTKAYKIKTTSNGYDKLADCLRMSKELYNESLEGLIESYKEGEKYPGLYGLYKQFTEYRNETKPEWSKYSLTLGRGALIRLDRTYKAFFRRAKEGTSKAGFPRFKSWRRYRSLEIHDVSKGMYKLSADKLKAKIKIKGLSVLKIRSDEPLSEALPKTMSLVKYPTGWHVIFAYEFEPEPLPKTDKQVGADMGVNKRMTLSDGSYLPAHRVEDRELKVLQRKLARQVKGSNRREKTRLQIARWYHDMKVRLRNLTHRETTWLIRNHDTIALEDLSIQSMTKSAKDTVEEPGKQVAQKRGLNRSIQGQRWGMIKQQLVYKAEWYGRKVVFIDPKHTSQLCYACGVIEPSNRKNQRYKCECGYESDADVNAALNILARSGGTCGNAPDKNLMGELSPMFL